MSTYPLMPRDPTNARDRAIAADANQAIDAMDTLAATLDRWGNPTLGRALRLWMGWVVAGVERELRR